jgi:hypothetical protein
VRAAGCLVRVMSSACGGSSAPTSRTPAVEQQGAEGRAHTSQPTLRWQVGPPSATHATRCGPPCAPDRRLSFLLARSIGLSRGQRCAVGDLLSSAGVATGRAEVCGLSSCWHRRLSDARTSSASSPASSHLLSQPGTSCRALAEPSHPASHACGHVVSGRCRSTITVESEHCLTLVGARP